MFYPQVLYKILCFSWWGYIEKFIGYKCTRTVSFDTLEAAEEFLKDYKKQVEPMNKSIKEYDI